MKIGPFGVGIAITTAVVSVFGMWKITMPAVKKKQRKEIEEKMNEFMNKKNMKSSNGF